MVRSEYGTHTMTNRSSGRVTDEPIAQAIEREIQARMQPGAPPIDVSAQDATVTPTGHVAIQATKEALIALACGTPGVVDVNDNLVIGGGHPFLDWFFPGRNPNQDLDDVDRQGGRPMIRMVTAVEVAPGHEGAWEEAWRTLGEAQSRYPGVQGANLPRDNTRPTHNIVLREAVSGRAKAACAPTASPPSPGHIGQA